MITVTYFVAAAGVRPDVLVDADHRDAVEAGGIVDQQPLVFGQDGVVRGVPCDPEAFSDPGHREVLDVATHGHLLGGGPPSQRLVRQATDHSVAGKALGTAPPTPPVGLYDPAGEDRPVGFRVAVR